MPRHDLPDGTEADGNLIDLGEYLRRRVEQAAQDNGDPGPEPSDGDVYGHAEYGDGKRPGFNRYDLLWLGMIATIGYVFWMLVRR